MDRPVQLALRQAVVEHLADAVIAADRRGVIQVWNPGAVAVFGYTEVEALGQRLDLIIPEHLQAAHWSGFDLAVESGKVKHGRESVMTRATHKSGSRLYVDLSFALVRDDADKTLGAVAVARDVTARFEADKARRKRIAELEAQLKVFASSD